MFASLSDNVRLTLAFDAQPARIILRGDAAKRAASGRLRGECLQLPSTLEPSGRGWNGTVRGCSPASPVSALHGGVLPGQGRQGGLRKAPGPEHAERVFGSRATWPRQVSREKQSTVSHAGASAPPEGHRRNADPRQLRTPTRVLVVADQAVLASVIRLALNHGPYVTRTEATGADGRAVVQQWRPHIVVIDMDVGDGALLGWFAQAASRGEHTPVIALTRRGDLKTKLAAFDRGVEDILTIPFFPEELVARVLVIMRRRYQDTAAFTPVIHVGELEIDILNRRVRAGAAELRLTSLEQSLLYLLAANAGRLVTREEILDNLWGTDYAAESNVVDRHVRNLRDKLQDDWRRPRFIVTVPGQGYRFVPASTAEPNVPLMA